ncbi:hypothetical protein XFF4834R_chr24690 [Xanthomonas citri pv. fuscans]|nr:hypothetical protein XFF4834R_chr24690 [Xanthomonas citri pv. fuscans]
MLRALARPPSQDTLQVRPCKLRGGIHAAKGPATVSGQGPVEIVGGVSASDRRRPLPLCLGAARLRHSSAKLRRLRTTSRFYKTADQLSGAVSSPVAGPLAAWMPPSSPHGWVYGVSRKQ